MRKRTAINVVAVFAIGALCAGALEGVSNWQKKRRFDRQVAELDRREAEADQLWTERAASGTGLEESSSSASVLRPLELASDGRGNWIVVYFDCGDFVHLSSQAGLYVRHGDESLGIWSGPIRLEPISYRGGGVFYEYGSTKLLPTQSGEFLLAWIQEGRAGAMDGPSQDYSECLTVSRSEGGGQQWRAQQRIAVTRELVELGYGWNPRIIDAVEDSQGKQHVIFDLTLLGGNWARSTSNDSGLSWTPLESFRAPDDSPCFNYSLSLQGRDKFTVLWSPILVTGGACSFPCASFPTRVYLTRSDGTGGYRSPARARWGFDSSLTFGHPRLYGKDRSVRDDMDDERDVCASELAAALGTNGKGSWLAAYKVVGQGHPGLLAIASSIDDGHTWKEARWAAPTNSPLPLGPVDLVPGNDGEWFLIWLDAEKNGTPGQNAPARLPIGLRFRLSIRDWAANEVVRVARSEDNGLTWVGLGTLGGMKLPFASGSER